jgi:hypothetical protein
MPCRAAGAAVSPRRGISALSSRELRGTNGHRGRRPDGDERDRGSAAAARAAPFPTVPTAAACSRCRTDTAAHMRRARRRAAGNALIEAGGSSAGGAVLTLVSIAADRAIARNEAAARIELAWLDGRWSVAERAVEPILALRRGALLGGGETWSTRLDRPAASSVMGLDADALQCDLSPSSREVPVRLPPERPGGGA